LVGIRAGVFAVVVVVVFPECPVVGIEEEEGKGGGGFAIGTDDDTKLLGGRVDGMAGGFVEVDEGCGREAAAKLLTVADGGEGRLTGGAGVEGEGSGGVGGRSWRSSSFSMGSEDKSMNSTQGLLKLPLDICT
jgi:hypothetical protein